MPLSLAFSLPLVPNGYVVANINYRLTLKTLRSPQGEDDPSRPNVRSPRRVLRLQFQTQRVILVFFPIHTTRHEPQGEGSRQACWAGSHFDPLTATWAKDRLRSMKLNLAAAGTLRSSIPAFDTHWPSDSGSP